VSFDDYQLNVVNAEGGGKIGNTLNAGGIVIDSLSASLKRHSPIKCCVTVFGFSGIKVNHINHILMAAN
jgi:hypothetical protein